MSQKVEFSVKTLFMLLEKEGEARMMEKVRSGNDAKRKNRSNRKR